MDEKCDDLAVTAEADLNGSVGTGMVRKRSETFNETLPSIPEAPHDAEIQGTWSAMLTTTDRATPKISAAALFEEMTATLGQNDSTAAPSLLDLASSSKNLNNFESENISFCNSTKKENYIENEDNKNCFPQKNLSFEKQKPIFNNNVSLLNK